MNERIKELAIDTGVYDCLTDPYDKLRNGDPHSSVLPDLERFAEMVIRECVARIQGCQLVEDARTGEFELGYKKAIDKATSQVKLHFGIK